MSPPEKINLIGNSLFSEKTSNKIELQKMFKNKYHNIDKLLINGYYKLNHNVSKFEV